MPGNQNLGVENERGDESYREFYLQADIKQSKLAMVLFAIPLIGFVFNDYMFFGLSNMFYGVISVRVALLFITGLELSFIGKVKSYRTYDKILVFAILAMIIGEA